MISRQTFVLFINQIQSIFTRRTTFLNWNNSKFKKNCWVTTPLSVHMYLVHFACHKIVPRVRAQMLHSEIHIAKYFFFWYFLVHEHELVKKTTLTHCPHIHVWRKVKLCKIARHEIVKKKKTPHPLKTHRKLYIVFLPCFLLSLVKALYRERLPVCSSYKVLMSCWRGVFSVQSDIRNKRAWILKQSF